MNDISINELRDRGTPFEMVFNDEIVMLAADKIKTVPFVTNWAQNLQAILIESVIIDPSAIIEPPDPNSGYLVSPSVLIANYTVNPGVNMFERKMTDYANEVNGQLAQYSELNKSNQFFFEYLINPVLYPQFVAYANFQKIQAVLYDIRVFGQLTFQGRYI